MSRVVQFRPVERGAARLVIGIVGQSGSGKTYTALQLAWGMAGGDASKVGLLDTENGRGSLYDDILVGRDGRVHKFMIARMDAPFSPERYADAIEDAKAAGVEVLVIDSVTHEWEGIGGCKDISEKTSRDGRKYTDWAHAKREHNRFMLRMLAADMHIIMCIRARDKVKIEGTGSNQKFIDMGEMPVCEKNTIFDLTMGIHVSDAGRTRKVLKPGPSGMREALDHDRDYITARDGMEIRKWLDGSGATDELRMLEQARNTLRVACDRGLAALESTWKSLTPEARQAVGVEELEIYKASARAFDAESRRNSATAGDEAADLDTVLNGGHADDDE